MEDVPFGPGGPKYAKIKEMEKPSWQLTALWIVAVVVLVGVVVGATAASLLFPAEPTVLASSQWVGMSPWWTIVLTLVPAVCAGGACVLSRTSGAPSAHFRALRWALALKTISVYPN